METMRMNKSLFPGPFLVERFAALQATKFGNELAFQKFILEGDALQVINAIKGNEDIWNNKGMLISDIKLLLSKFTSWSVNHVKRDLNTIAHVLGKDALTISDVIIDLASTPRCIESLL